MRVAYSSPGRAAQVGDAVPLSRRRRPPSSKVERDRRQAFGAEWGKFMQQARKHLQEATSE